ncbi:MAG: cytochrome c maturation protein CcmE [Rickettsiales bacterium]
MKPKHQRLIFVLGSLMVMGIAATIILFALRDNMVFFYTPTQLIENKAQADFDTSRGLRIGGLVKQGSIKNLKSGGIRFVVTDLTSDIAVEYQGLVPSLFRDGQGVVAQGTLGADGVMQASGILAKHDETYMPRDVVEALKKSGRWQVYGGAYTKGERK